MNLGSHMSIAGGVYKALELGRSIDCHAVQIFTKNNNQWAGKPISDEDAARFHELAKEYTPEFLISHSSYLINLASPGGPVLEKSIPGFVDELERAELLGLAGVVIHPGSHVGEGEEKGISQIAKSLNMVFKKSKGLETLVLLETTAGQGTNLGYTFEQLAGIIELSDHPERIGICLDTCHVFAAGYPVHERKGYLKTMREFDSVLGLDRLRAIHFNDSKKPFGSKRDRHEHIGQGEIGEDAFSFFLNDKRLKNIPMILETPKSKDLHEDVENLKVLRGLRKKK